MTLLGESRLAGQSQAWADVTTRDKQAEQADVLRFLLAFIQ